MKRILLVMSLILIMESCIPIRIAPNINDYEITKGKNFKKSLPRRQMFIFEDPKEANHFYDYINTKFNLDDTNVYDDVPFNINGQQYFLSFYETEIPNKTINLLPTISSALFNAAIGNTDNEDISDPEMVRNGNWYIAIEVYNDIEKDCLSDDSLSRTQVLKYLRDLKKEYLSTHNYNEVIFTN